LFDSFKKFLGWKKPKEEETLPEPEIPDLGVDIGLPKKAQAIPLPVIADDSYTNNLLNKSKNSIKYTNNTERGLMAEKFLVVLDTSNRPEVTDRGLKGGLKNFYFIAAANPDQAKQIVLSTFARTPHIVQQIQYSLTVTPLSRIAPHVNEQTPVWSYIPLRKGSKAPGQQSTPPSQAINPNNTDEVIPMQIPPAPITPPTQNDTPKMAEIPPEAQANNPMAAMMSPTLPNGQPNPMFAMLQMFQAAMAGGTAPAAPTVPPKSIVTRGDPDNDPELAARLAEVRSTAVARHVNHDPSAMDDELSHAERKAAAEVENFKSLDKSEQGARGLTSVQNDIDPALMGQMTKTLGKMEVGQPEDKAPTKKRK